MRRLTAALFCLSALAGSPVAAQSVTPAPAATPPKLIVAISVDQLGGDLFAGYRQHFAGGMARMQSGVVFADGYQAQSATETCPGHSTLLTGSYPARSGIIANDWIDPASPRADKTIYCAEDERVPGSTSRNYTVSPVHLKVPTLGDRLKAANPASRTVAVSGKDRSAVMMAGPNADQIWWWGGQGFVSYAGRAEPAAVTRGNAAVATRLAAAQPPLTLPEQCRSRDRAIDIGGGKTVGTGRFAREAGDARAFRASPELDASVLAIAAALVQEMKLGSGAATDVLTVGLAATDYVGHTYGNQGTEMCLNLLSLDRDLAGFFAVLDRTGVDYMVVLSADHGGHDLPERVRMQGFADAQRVDPALNPVAIGEAVARDLGLTGRVLWGGNSGDLWLDPAIPAKDRARVLAAAVARLSAHPQVESVLTREQLSAMPMPTASPERWTIADRARATFHAERSGDLFIALKQRVTPIADPTGGYVATHGSVWDYDRWVPILFWRRGMPAFEQPLPIATVDILPTLAGVLALPIPAGEIDGVCRDLDAGAGTNCPAQ